MIGETVIRKRSTGGGVDDYGDPIPGTTTEVPIHGCLVSPRESSELTSNGRAGVIIGLTVYAPPSADVVSTDQVIVRGTTYNVEGEPGLWASPFTGPRGLQFALERVEG